MSTWNRKLNRLFKENAQFRGDYLRLKQTMEMRSSERRNSDMAQNENNQELDSQRLELYHANQWADQAPREKIYLCGGLGEIDSSKIVAQQIVKKLRSYEESVSKKQIEPDT